MTSNIEIILSVSYRYIMLVIAKIQIGLQTTEQQVRSQIKIVAHGIHGLLFLSNR